MTERLITLCIAIFVLVVAPVATDAAGQAQNQGQQEPQEPPTQEEEEEVAIPSYAETIVVTATRTEVQILDAPATVSVITSDIIANSPAQNFGDLLSSVPGMNVSQTSARDINLTTRAAARRPRSLRLSWHFWTGALSIWIFLASSPGIFYPSI